MYEHIKRLLYHFVVYGLGNVAGRLVSFLLLPIVLRYLTPEDYGVLEIFQVLKNICIAFLPLGLASSIFRYYFKADDLSEKEEIVNTAFWLLLGFSLTFSLVCFFNKETLSVLLWGNRDYGPHVMVVAGTVALEIIKVVPFALYRAKERSKAYAALQLFHITSNLTLNIVFLVVFRMGIMAILLGGLLSTLMVILLLSPAYSPYLVPRIKSRDVKRLLRYGFPVAIVSLIFLLLNGIDRFFIKHFCSLDELGVYALGSRFSGLLNLFLITPFSLVWLPFALSLEKDPKHKEIYSTVLTYFLFLSCLLSLAIAMLTPEVIRIISPESYWGDYRFVILLTFSAIFFVLNRNLGIGISLKEKTEYHMFAAILALGINAGLNYLLVPILGINGAAISNMAAFVGMMVFTFMVSKRIYPIRYECRRILHLLLVFLAILFGSLSVSVESLGASILIKLLLIGCFPLCLYLTRFLKPMEIDRVKQILKSRLDAS